MPRQRVELTEAEKAAKFDLQRDLHAQYTRDWISRNTERYRDIQKTYYQANKERLNAATVERRRAQRGGGGGASEN